MNRAALFVRAANSWEAVIIQEIIIPKNYTLIDVSNLLRQRFRDKATVTHWPPILKVRLGLNTGANVRLLMECQPTKVEAVSRSFMDDHASNIVKITGAACGFLGLALAILYWHWATGDMDPEAYASRAGSMAKGGAGMCMLWMGVGAVMGSIAGMIGTTVVASRAAMQANRQWARELEQWLNETLTR